MKGKRWLLSIVFFSVFHFSLISACRATVGTFDDIPNANAPYPHLTNGYYNLSWTNFAVLNAIHEAAINGTNGGYYGMVSPSNVAFNAFGDPAEVKATGTDFDFLGAYLTGAWRSNLSIEVQGFSGATMLYDTTVVVSAISPSFVGFNYVNVDRLRFSSFGGQYAGFGSDAPTFVMDNFTFEFVPEPSSLLLTAGGALLLMAGFKRRRA
jgi:hypothetical protein